MDGLIMYINDLDIGAPFPHTDIYPFGITIPVFCVTVSAISTTPNSGWIIIKRSDWIVHWPIFTVTFFMGQGSKDSDSVKQNQ